MYITYLTSWNLTFAKVASNRATSLHLLASRAHSSAFKTEENKINDFEEQSWTHTNLN